jgi:hypothetical protein
VALQVDVEPRLRVDPVHRVGTLEHLAHSCHGDARPDCPILDDLAGGPT